MHLMQRNLMEILLEWNGVANYTSLTFLEIKNKMISDSMLLNDDWLQNLALLEHLHGFENLQP